MSKITKKALENAFSALLEERPFSKITVADVANKAGVNRHTFYYHYRNIDDMIVYCVKEAIEKIYNGAGYTAEDNDGFLELLIYVYNHRQYMLAIMHSSSRAQFMRAVEDSLYNLIDNLIERTPKYSTIKNADRDFVVRFYLYGVTGLFENWMDMGMAESPDRVAEVIARILKTDLIADVKG
ncbi:MAG: TetR/AcrR family transcriptional regulator [Spirochaetales bacterium]|nr:TetR/AcrR family transcriptional regulator [Spirochaetales bacterium]